MKNIISIFLLSLLIAIANAQAPSIQWQKSLGGSKSEFQPYTKLIHQTNDGGYIVGGDSRSDDGDINSHNGATSTVDYWIVKLDANGNKQWQKSLGGTDDDNIVAIQQTTDGGYIIGGSSYSNDGNVTGHHGTTSSEDYWVIKLDFNGNIQWQKSLGGSNGESLAAIYQTTDGGYIIGGISVSNDGDVTGHHGTVDADYWIVKLDVNGNIQWQKSFGGTAAEDLDVVLQTADGGYLIGGVSHSNDGDITNSYLNADYWIVKLDVNGNMQWQKSFGGTSDDNLKKIHQTFDGGYLIAGNSYSNDGNVTGNHSVSKPDYWVVKIDGVGNLQWQKTLGGTQAEFVEDILQIASGEYIISGNAMSDDGDINNHHGSIYAADYWIVKLGITGNILWQKSFGGFSDDWAKTIQQTIDGGFIIAGYSKSNNGDVTGHHGLIYYEDYWIVKIDATGNMQWEKSFGGTDSDFLSEMLQTTDGGYVLTGASYSIDGDVTGHHGTTSTTDYWIVKLNTATDIPNYSFKDIKIYPNPTSGIMAIHTNNQVADEIAVVDIVGNIILAQIPTNTTPIIDLTPFSAGIYFVKIVIDGEPHSVKVINK